MRFRKAQNSTTICASDVYWYCRVMRWSGWDWYKVWFMYLLAALEGNILRSTNAYNVLTKTPAQMIPKLVDKRTQRKRKNIRRLDITSQ